VGNSVIAPVPNFIAEYRRRQRVSLCDYWHRPVKRSVENCDLPEFGIGFCQRADGIQLEWLVQRHDRYELLELSEHFLVDESRPLVSAPALHHAMADRDDLEVRFVTFKPSDDEFERLLPIERAFLVPSTRRDNLALGVLRSEARL